MANNRMILVNTATAQRVLIANHLATAWYFPPTDDGKATWLDKLDDAFNAEVELHGAPWGSTAWRIEYEHEEPDLDAELKVRAQGSAMPTTTIDQLRVEREALTKVYVVAARLRQFPVPFDDHFELVGAVDQCRSVLEPPVDHRGDHGGDHRVATPSAPDQAVGWQEYVAAYPREEFLIAFREAHSVLHRLWSAQVGKEGYDKAEWQALDNALSRFARDAAEKVGISRTEPLL